MNDLVFSMKTTPTQICHVLTAVFKGNHASLWQVVVLCLSMLVNGKEGI